ncbi:MAG: endopeptidase La [Sulfuricaulis sp.]|nr:endopeptidase La [Sulfuricaulis sp.]
MPKKEEELLKMDAEGVNDSPPVEPVEGGQLARPSDVLPGLLHILPLANRPFFPAQMVPLVVDRAPWQRTLELAVESGNPYVGLVLIRGDDPQTAGPDDFYTMGTASRIHKVVQLDDKLQIFVEGMQRFRIESWVSRERPFAVRAQYFPETSYKDVPELKAYTVAVINTIKELLPLNPLYGEELKYFLNRFGPDDPARLADFAASLTTSDKQELQEVLEKTHILERMEKVLVLLKKEVEVAKAQMQIHKKVEESMEKRQREFLLREQMKAIQKELGIAKDDRTAELDKFRARLKDLTLPEEAQKRIDEEIEKLSVLEVGSPEYGVTRNYLDWLTQLPWGKYSDVQGRTSVAGGRKPGVTKDKLDLKHARKILDRDHDGLADVKDRIIEFLAVGSMKGEIAGSILLLVGPPGVGKTSVGRSIAQALGRKFYRFSLGGMRDEAEIKGHRRTYIGALPGKFIQAIKDVAVANPVIMLDEIDKIGASYQGDPASALLEVLDPEQNKDFLDHYLDVRFDLSKVLFVATANQLDTIPAPLLDRMEIIRLSGYITSEKMAIAEHHLIPRQIEKAGLKNSQLKIETAALREVIERYAREAGVRNLEKRLGQIARKTVVKILNGVKTPIHVGVKNIEEYLGKPVFRPEKPQIGVGVVTGLAWTPLGGVTLDVEATRVHQTTRGFKLTGQLGDVMKESAEIAYSYISSHSKTYGAKPDYFEKAFVHLHVPAGATPKDGPSAGVTMATTLLSLARGVKIVRPLAMTGELTLTGQVLPVGGIREKVIAARRAKISELILPEANRGDFDDLPEHIRKGLKAHFASHYQDVARVVFPKKK